VGVPLAQTNPYDAVIVALNVMQTIFLAFMAGRSRRVRAQDEELRELRRRARADRSA
jgi:hypothetical protein